ncbi:hypothetical protein GCM10010156_70520 [Planobispora rosea]|uniref:Methylamine utilisation protein MauE domain-containing protein n=2 Tax=Planobispora rosea TaxID=35762 RepID=A0A8J3S5Z0_PLARO|nr:hypothetical protein GCM10010156_70520 [Planobispora rosea]GIH88537.1 hypothetical protein Pro02_69450 [Planobispora rosea]
MTQMAHITQMAQTTEVAQATQMTEAAQLAMTVATAQLPVLSVLLALGTAAKVRTVAKGTQPGGMSGLGPAVLLAERWHAPAMLGCAAGEAVLLGGLMATGHPLFRWGTTAFFTISTYVLWELRRRRPDAGCGCFGDVSAVPVGFRSLARTAVLTAMAAGTVWAGPVSGWSVLAGISWITALAMVIGLLLIAALSPEIEEIASRLRYRAPCENRPSDPAKAESLLRASTVWQSHAWLLARAEPVDSWRELCWRFFVYPGIHPGLRAGGPGEPVDVVFAIRLSGRRPAVRVAVVDAAGRTVGIESPGEPASVQGEWTHARHDSALYGSLASPLESRIEG